MDLLTYIVQRGIWIGLVISLRSPAIQKVEAFGGGTARGLRTSEKNIESFSKARMWRLHARATRIVAPGEMG